MRLAPADRRPGWWTFLMQATVGATKKWDEKLQVRRLRSWSDYLGDPLQPILVLTIPHHIEAWHLHDLVANGEGATVFDRLRLVTPSLTIVAHERRRAREIFEAGTEW